MQPHPTPDDLPLGLLPRELLLALVDAAPFPLLCYCQLIGLTHGIRSAIRGSLRGLSFQSPVPLEDYPGADDYCLAPCLPADALAAIVGPCKGLVRLALPSHNSRHPAVLGCGLFDVDSPEAATAWADEAFGGHSQLAVLEIPGAATLWPAIMWILPHLPGLEEVHYLQARPLRARILNALATFCPKLRVLHLGQHTSASHYTRDFGLLGPLAGTLHELVLPDSTLADGTLRSLVSGLPLLKRLEVKSGGMALRPLAQHLTHYTDNDLPAQNRGDLAGLNRLETLAAGSFSGDDGYAPVVAACRDTLRSLSLFTRADVSPGGGLLAALGGLARLTRLKLTLRGEGGTLSAVLAALPPGLLENQLEYLSLDLEGDSTPARPPRIVHADPELPLP
ncbi:hypothetical protein PAPYR_7836 [Paratrimastix pyriformis]|uniref:Uncharacterized protein n=1 Tax=Paratrimastix pyriformis TaxID=342808 RepID=A0ABQ8UGJ1_9EUKA|nr:hypothetical protein PAPYR_7836 [Paratrimastix pyriformis]